MHITITKDIYDTLIIHSQDFREQVWRELNKTETPEFYAEECVRNNGPERWIQSVKDVRTEFTCVSLADGKKLVRDAMLKVWDKTIP
jgi:hypothetical protein